MRARFVVWLWCAALVGCAGGSSTVPEGPAVRAVKVERFDAGRQANGPTRHRYLPAGADPGTWLEVARAPDRRAVAVALGDAVELRAWPGLARLWRAPVSPDEPYGSQPTHPLLTFTRDGSRVAWLGGVGLDHRFIVFVAETGAVETDVVFDSLAVPGRGGGGGITPEPMPEVLQAAGDGRFLIHNTFETYELDPGALRMATLADTSRFGLAVNAAQDSGVPWDLVNSSLIRRGGGGTRKVDCRYDEDQVAIDEGLDRVAYLCADGTNPEGLPEVHLLRLSTGELLGVDVFPAKWGRLVILDADTVLAVSFGGTDYTVLLSPVAQKDARYVPAEDRWEFMAE